MKAGKNLDATIVMSLDITEQNVKIFVTRKKRGPSRTTIKIMGMNPAKKQTPIKMVRMNSVSQQMFVKSMNSNMPQKMTMHLGAIQTHMTRRIFRISS